MSDSDISDSEFTFSSMTNSDYDFTGGSTYLSDNSDYDFTEDDTHRFDTLDSWNNYFENKNNNPIIKEKKEFLEVLNNSNFEQEWRELLAKQNKTNKTNKENEMKEYMEKSGKEHIINLYKGVKNNFRNSEGKYIELNYEENLTIKPNYEKNLTIKYTVLLHTNGSYYDSIGLLAISYDNDYTTNRDESLDNYIKHINTTLYKKEDAFPHLSLPNRTKKTVYENNELDIVLLHITDFQQHAAKNDSGPTISLSLTGFSG